MNGLEDMELYATNVRKKFKKHIKAVKNGLEKDGYKSGWSSFLGYSRNVRGNGTCIRKDVPR